MVCAAVSRLVGGKTDVVMMLNGALGGLVSITAEPLHAFSIINNYWWYWRIIMYYGTQLLIRLKLDDVVGAIPSTWFCWYLGNISRFTYKS